MVVRSLAGVSCPQVIWSRAMSCLLKRLPWKQMSSAHWRWRTDFQWRCLGDAREVALRLGRYSVADLNDLFRRVVFKHRRQRDIQRFAYHEKTRRADAVPTTFVFLNCSNETPSFLPSCSWLILSASLCSRIRAPMYLSMAFGLRGEIFLFGFFIVVDFQRVGKSNSPERLRRDRHLNGVATFPSG
jgi:hypothetical protein